MYLLAAIGGVVMGSANDLVVLFLGLEILSIALYVMAASHRRRIESQESGIKYFILGGFSSAFFLYGIAMVYGTAGSTNFTTIVESFNANVPVVRHDAFILAGVGLLMVGLGVQGHRRSVPLLVARRLRGRADPGDVVHGVGRQGRRVRRVDARPDLRAAALARRLPADRLGARRVDRRGRLGAGGRADQREAHARVLVDQPRRLHPDRRRSRIAPRRRNPTRATASRRRCCTCCCTRCWSSARSRWSRWSPARATAPPISLRSAAWARPIPVLSLAMTVLLLAQAGVPLTSGFVAKFGVIEAAVEERSYAIAIIAMVASVIAAFLYLRIMISMWVSEPESGDDAREADPGPAVDRRRAGPVRRLHPADRLLPRLADRRHQSRRRRLP